MNKWQELGFSAEDIKEIESIRSRTPEEHNDLPIAPSKEEMTEILNSCAAILGFKYDDVEQSRG